MAPAAWLTSNPEIHPIQLRGDHDRPVALMFFHIKIFRVMSPKLKKRHKPIKEVLRAECKVRQQVMFQLCRVQQAISHYLNLNLKNV